MQLDSGLTLAETIEAMQAERLRLGPTFEFASAADAVAFINVFGAFK